MMNITVFFLLGMITGLGSALLFFRLDAAWLKAISFSGGAAILIGEFVVLSEFFNITQDNRATVFSAFLGAWLLTFLIILPVMLRLLKKQESKYKIHTWEILLGDKKAIDDYYNLKREQIKKLLEDELNVEQLEEEREHLNKEKASLAEEKAKFEREKEIVADVISRNYHLVIPVGHKYPVTNRYFDLLPRHLTAISSFYHQVISFTEDFVGSVDEQLKSSTEENVLKTYLLSLCYYVGQLLFDWREVRIHFRVLNKSINQYESYVAVHNNGEEYKKVLTPMPANKGLIYEAYRHKRSLVKSANLNLCLEGGNDHIWKDYITMIFEDFSDDNYPLLTLGVSVKHDADHKDMLYFLSFIQVEQFIQENLLKLNEIFSITETLSKESV